VVWTPAETSRGGPPVAAENEGVGWLAWRDVTPIAIQLFFFISRPCLDGRERAKFDIVALSFVFDNYCLIMD
jgi:hypothetical protein